MATFDPFSMEFDSLLTDKWLKASEADKEIATIFAASEIEQRFNFRGATARYSHAMGWPRVGAVGDDGQPINGVPEVVKLASSFLAASHVAGYSIEHPKILARLILILEGVTDQNNPLRREPDNEHRPR